MLKKYPARGFLYGKPYLRGTKINKDRQAAVKVKLPANK
jgi:hypothetical protein